jgi:hypothetical protein
MNIALLLGIILTSVFAGHYTPAHATTTASATHTFAPSIEPTLPPMDTVEANP